MLNVFRSWIQKYFSNEEALILVCLLIASWVVLITMGPIIAPMLASIVIAFLLQGLVDFLKRRGAPHLLAVFMAFSLLVSILVTFIVVVLPILWQQIIRLISEFPNMVHQVQAGLDELSKKYPSLINAQQIQELNDLSSQQFSHLGQKVLTVSMKGAPIVAAVILYFILVPILVFLFLKDSELILNWLGRFLPKKRPMMRRIWKEMNQQAANYVRGKVLQIFVVIAFSYLIFAILGLHYAVLLAILVGISVLIPYIGVAAASVPVIVVGFFQWGFAPDFFYLLIAFGAMHALDGNVLVPLIFSEAVKLHPIAIILAVLVFGGLWGFWGVFFAIPLATLVKAIIYAWPKAEVLNEK